MLNQLPLGYRSSLKMESKNRDVPVADYYEVLEDYDPKFGYLYNNLVDGFFTEEEAT